MKKMAKTAALLAALVLTAAFAQDFPEYLKMDGTKVTGYSGKLPAELVIPEGVTAIAAGAFKGCLDIDSVTIPGSVTKIDGYVFSFCDNLKIQYDGTKTQWNAISGYPPNRTIQCKDGTL